MSVLVYTENWDGMFRKSTFEASSYASETAKLLETEVIAISLGEVSNDELYSALQIALKEYRIKDASAQISEQFGVSRKRTYEMALKIKANK